MQAETLERSPLRQFRPGEYIYRQGDPRSYTYFVLSGSIALFQSHTGCPSGVLVVAGRGEYVGLGCLGHYPDNAKALSHTTTAIYSRDDFARLTENSRELRAIQAAAIENEFEFVKRSIEPARRTPTEAVAAYLVAISSLNAREGRDPRIVDADVNSGIVADLLHMDIYTLQKALIELKRYNLIGVDDDGAIRLNEPLLLAALTDNEEA